MFFINHIGTGLYGNVMLVCDEEDSSRLYALKVISKDLLITKDKVLTAATTAGLGQFIPSTLLNFDTAWTERGQCHDQN